MHSRTARAAPHGNMLMKLDRSRRYGAMVDEGGWLRVLGGEANLEPWAATEGLAGRKPFFLLSLHYYS